MTALTLTTATATLMIAAWFVALAGAAHGESKPATMTHCASKETCNAQASQPQQKKIRTWRIKNDPGNDRVKQEHHK
jgi:hypothetical protein